MDWFRDKTKKHLFVLLSEFLPNGSTKLSLINIDTNKINHLILEGKNEIIQASLDESPQRLLLYLKRNGKTLMKRNFGLRSTIFQKKEN
jgi:hypothetical protein